MVNIAKSTPSVSVIIPSFNGKHLLKDCLLSLYELKYPSKSLEIKIVDNASTDGTAEYVRKNFRKVRVLRNNENNFCKANNLGIRNSRSEMLAFLNDDTRVDKDWLKELVDAVSKDSRIGCAGSKVLFMDGRIQSAGHYEFPNFRWGDRGLREPDLGQYEELDEVNSLSGSSVLFRRSCLDDVGYFDEDFVMYLEDVDIFLRCRRNNWKLLYVPKSIVHHLFHGTADENFVRFYVERNRLLLIAKHFPDELGRSLENSAHLFSRGELFKVLPDMFMKLYKHHGDKIDDARIRSFFESLQHVYNFEKDKAVQELNDIARQAREQWEKTRSEKETAAQAVSVLEKEKEKQASQIEELKGSYGALIKENSATLEHTVREMEGFKKDVLAKAELVDMLTKEKSAVEDKLTAKDSEVRDKQKETESLRLDLMQLQVQINMLQVELNQSRALLDQASGQRDELRQEINADNSIIQGLKEQAHQLEIERERYRGKIESLSLELSHGQDSLNKLQEDNAVFLARDKANSETIGRLKEDRYNLGLEQALLKARLDSLQAELEKSSLELSERNKALDHLQISFNRLQEEFASREQTAQVLEGKLKQSTEEKALALEKLLCLEKELLRLETLQAEKDRAYEESRSKAEQALENFKKEMEGAGLQVSSLLQRISDENASFIKEKDSLLNQFRAKEEDLLRQLAAAENTAKNLNQALSLKEKENRDKEAFIQRLFQSKTYRFLVIPFWRLLDSMKWIAGYRKKENKTILVIKPYYAPAALTIEAISELRQKFGKCSITLFANVFDSDAAYLEQNSGADKKVIFSPGQHKLTLPRLLRSWFWMNFNYFDQAILLIGPPVYHGYRKGKVLLFSSGAKSIQLYFMLSKTIALPGPTGSLKKVKAAASLAWGSVAFIFVICFFFVAIVIPLKIRKLFSR